MRDIVIGAKRVQEARNYYGMEFADFRRETPTPYRERLHFTPGDGSAADPGVRILSDADLEAAAKEGKERD